MTEKRKTHEMMLANKKIFVVEDNVQNRLIFGLVLRKYGAFSYFEAWGDAAITQLKCLAHVDLVILDLMLTGGVSGFDIFEKIRTLPNYNETPIVAVSAIEPSIGIQQTQEKGFSGFIAKPINDVLFPQQLVRIMQGESIWYAGERQLE